MDASTTQNIGRSVESDTIPKEDNQYLKELVSVFEVEIWLTNILPYVIIKKKLGLVLQKIYL